MTVSHFPRRVVARSIRARGNTWHGLARLVWAKHGPARQGFLGIGRRDARDQIPTDSIVAVPGGAWRGAARMGKAGVSIEPKWFAGSSPGRLIAVGPGPAGRGSARRCEAGLGRELLPLAVGRKTKEKAAAVSAR
jgi:hypothetical protein